MTPFTQNLETGVSETHTGPAGHLGGCSVGVAGYMSICFAIIHYTLYLLSMLL